MAAGCQDGYRLPGCRAIAIILLAGSASGSSVERADGIIPILGSQRSAIRGARTAAWALQIYTHPFLMLQGKTSKAPPGAGTLDPKGAATARTRST